MGDGGVGNGTSGKREEGEGKEKKVKRQGGDTPGSCLYPPDIKS